MVTGASSGIGAAFARALPKSTALVLTGRDREALSRLAGELALNGRQIRIIVADLSKSEGRSSLAAAASEQPIDLLINNAGVGWLGRLIDTPEARVSEMVLVNALAVVELSRSLLPAMLARARQSGERCGMIVLSSTAAFMPIPYFSIYAATKAFDLHFAEALAEEMTGEPIDILALCPGATQTRFFDRANVVQPVATSIHGADRVAHEGLQAIGHRRVHVVGSGNYLAAAASKFLPRRLVTLAAERVMRRWR
jgi:short-subunit dehydrogenase